MKTFKTMLYLVMIAAIGITGYQSIRTQRTEATRQEQVIAQQQDVVSPVPHDQGKKDSHKKAKPSAIPASTATPEDARRFLANSQPDAVVPVTPKQFDANVRPTVLAPEPASSSDGICEWVNPLTKEDGTEVKGHWSSKPGFAGTCPPHEASPTYVGPRGGVYHYSKSGKKVYTHRK